MSNIIEVYKINVNLPFQYIGRLTEKLMKEKDKRVKLMSEIIRGIRVIKYHVWEKYFIDKISGMSTQFMMLTYYLF